MAFLIVFVFFYVCDAEHYDVYLMGGQSNADGRANVSELSGDLASWSGEVPGVLAYYVNPVNKNPLAPSYDTGWINLQPGLSIAPGYYGAVPSPTFGFEVSLFRILEEYFPDQNVAFIKVTKGGTSLHTDWNPAGSSANYMWQTFTNFVPQAIATLTNAGHSVTLRGMVWHQGEADRDNDDFQSDLTDFIAAVRAFVGEAEFPFVLGELEQDTETANVDDVKRAIRNEDIRAVAESDGYVGVASSFGLLTQDGTHFNSASQVEFGIRYAEQVFAMGGGVPRLYREGFVISNATYSAGNTGPLSDSGWSVYAEDGSDFSGISTSPSLAGYDAGAPDGDGYRLAMGSGTTLDLVLVSDAGQITSEQRDGVLSFGLQHRDQYNSGSLHFLAEVGGAWYVSGAFAANNSGWRSESVSVESADWYLWEADLTDGFDRTGISKTGEALPGGAITEIGILVNNLSVGDYYRIDDVEIFGNPPSRILDQDEDGLSDLWEIYEFGSLGVSAGGDDDQDGDHFSDEFEYRAGTDPSDSFSRLAFNPPVVSAEGDGMTLSWSSVSGRFYNVSSAGSLRGVWTNLISGVLAVGSVTTQSVSFSETGTSAFFRVSLNELN